MHVCGPRLLPHQMNTNSLKLVCLLNKYSSFEGLISVESVRKTHIAQIPLVSLCQLFTVCADKTEYLVTQTKLVTS